MISRNSSSPYFDPSRPSPRLVTATLARLAALVGAQQIGVPVPLDSHRPDAVELAHDRVAAEHVLDLHLAQLAWITEHSNVCLATSPTSCALHWHAWESRWVWPGSVLAHRRTAHWIELSVSRKTSMK